MHGLCFILKLQDDHCLSNKKAGPSQIPPKSSEIALQHCNTATLQPLMSPSAPHPFHFKHFCTSNWLLIVAAAAVIDAVWKN